LCAVWSYAPRFMTKGPMEIRDPLHVFVRLDPQEHDVLNSAPFQRLRSIHQLALTYLVYPGATHRRFEHSLGVMELATRIFDVVTSSHHVQHDEARDVIPQEDDRRMYWRRVLRLAALFHDVGHLPFSHAAEDELLPEGVDHEAISWAYIFSDEMRAIWENMEPPVKPEHIALLAVGPGSPVEAVPPWQAILGEIITGDVFGADRMDYLLRDSLHTGVAYGRFDHHRLIDTLRILPASPTGPAGGEDGTREPTLGITEGGVQSAEALLLARYFSFSQVYFHRARRIYDIHLKDFLKVWREDRGGVLPHEPAEHLALTDNEVLVAIYEAARRDDEPLRTLARRVVERGQRFGLIYSPGPDDLAVNVDAGKQVAAALSERYGNEAVRYDRYGKQTAPFDFPVLRRDGEVVSSTGMSTVLATVPVARFDYVFLDRQHFDDAEAWLQESRQGIIEAPEVEEEDQPEGVQPQADPEA
jgi:HD superfamily phosphohydrolase